MKCDDCPNYRLLKYLPPASDVVLRRKGCIFGENPSTCVEYKPPPKSKR
ncbi:MAG: hypothetical protein V2A77_05080 [Pseudomonadota bacterium]